MLISIIFLESANNCVNDVFRSQVIQLVIKKQETFLMRHKDSLDQLFGKDLCSLEVISTC